MEEVCKDGKDSISLVEYTEMVALHPSILDSMTIPLNFLRRDSEQMDDFEKSFRNRKLVKHAERERKASLVTGSSNPKVSRAGSKGKLSSFLTLTRSHGDWMYGACHVVVQWWW